MRKPNIRVSFAKPIYLYCSFSYKQLTSFHVLVSGLLNQLVGKAWHGVILRDTKQERYGRLQNEDS